MAVARRATAEWNGTATRNAREREQVLPAACEPMSNAYQHTPGPAGLDLDPAAGRVTVSVTDTCTREPVMRPWRPQEPHGRGRTSWTACPPPGESLRARRREDRVGDPLRP